MLNYQRVKITATASKCGTGRRMDFAHPRRPKIEMWFGAVLTCPKEMEGLRPWFTDFSRQRWSMSGPSYDADMNPSQIKQSLDAKTRCFCCRVEKELAVGWAWGQRCENVVQGFGVKTSTWCSELGSAQFLLQTKGAVSGRICKMSDHELIRAVETLVPYWIHPEIKCIMCNGVLPSWERQRTWPIATSRMMLNS